MNNIVSIYDCVRKNNKSSVMLHGRYNLHTSDEEARKVSTTTRQQQVELPNGGVYTIVLKQNASSSISDRMWERYVIVEPNTLSIFWQVYILYYTALLTRVSFGKLGHRKK